MWSNSSRTPEIHQSGKGIYQSQCTICHRDDMKGSPPLFPSLVGVGNRMTQEQIADRIRKGGGRMPGFPNLAAGGS